MSVIKNKTIMLIKSTLLSVIVMLIGVVIFGFIIQTASLSSTVIKPVNQFIKIIAIFIGCYFGIEGKKGYISGGVVGITSTLITHLLLLMFTGVSVNVLNTVLDILFCGVVGAICGILRVNIKAKE